MPKPVDRDRLHQLFMNGLPIPSIAKELGITRGSCKTIIASERKKDPYRWPVKRQGMEKHLESKEPPLMMHLYECTGPDCFVQFAVEDYEEVDQSAVVCPICKSDEHLEDAGYGSFTVTIKAACGLNNEDHGRVEGAKHAW